MKFRLFWQLILSHLVVALIVLCGTGYIFFYAAESHVNNMFESAWRQEYERIVEFMEENMDLAPSRRIGIINALSTMRIQVHDDIDDAFKSDFGEIERNFNESFTQGTFYPWRMRLYYGQNGSHENEQHDYEFEIINEELTIRDRAFSIERPPFPFNNGDDAISFVAFPSTLTRDQVISIMSSRLIQVSIVALVLLIVLSWIMSRNIIKPINQLASGTMAVASGSFDYSLPSGPYGELEIVRKNFNYMSSQIKSNFTKVTNDKANLKNLIQDMAHQIKTPITSISTYNQILLDGAINDEYTAKEFLTAIQGQVERLGKLSQTLITLARIDSDTNYLSLTESDLNETVKNSVKTFSQRAIEKGVHITEQYTDKILLLLHDQFKLQEGIENIIDNAIKFTSKGGNVCVSTGDDYKVIISDTGPGISEDEILHIFDRFYQGTSGKRESDNTCGLGLAISKSMIEAHGGSIDVKSKEGFGTTFVLQFIPHLE